MAKKITQIIEDQVQGWSRQSMQLKESGKMAQHLPIITISREFASGGSDLAKLLSQKLNYEIWDKELLQAIAHDSKHDEKFLKSLDERRRRAVEDAVLGFVRNAGSNVSYLRSLIRVVKTIESHGKSIIVGRGANYICTMPSSLHVRIVCPFHERLRRHARRTGVSETKAGREVEKKDADRNDFIRYYFKRNVAEPSDYDLLLNSNTFDNEQMAAIILEAYQQKIGHRLQIQSVE